SGRLFADETQLGQALINVLTNSLEATETCEGPRRIRVSVAQEAGFWAVRIGDNGPGIAPEIIDHLFNGVSSTKPKGTGTGLKLARQIALAHGGNREPTVGSAGHSASAFPCPCLTCGAGGGYGPD